MSDCVGIVGPDLYKQDGVNVDLGDLYSKFAGGLCKQTYQNNPHILVHDFSGGLFRGPRCFEPIDLPPGTMLDIDVDGNGTKPIITDAAFQHRQSSRDWVAMCAGDKTRYGGYPALLANDLNIKTFGKDRDSQTFHAVCELMLGLKEVADENNYVMYKGETAEMGPCGLFGQPAGNAYVHLVRDGLRLCSSQECNYGKERESRSKDCRLARKGTPRQWWIQHAQSIQYVFR